MPRRFAQTLCLISLVLCLMGCGRREPGTPSPTAASPPATNPASSGPSAEFLRLMNAGKNYFEQGDLTNAVATFRKAAAIAPNDLDVHLNLANAHLMGGAAEEAIREADQALGIEPNSAAAHFIKGSAFLRAGRPEEAVKALENARRIEPGVTATLFQLGLARMGLQQWEEAIKAFREGLALEPNRLHAAAHYLLGQALIRAGRQQEGENELQRHQAGIDAGEAVGAAAFERSKYTLIRVPFKLEQPEKDGIPVRFVEATTEVFGSEARNFSGPAGVIDPVHGGWNGLFVLEREKGFRWLLNTNGSFRPIGPAFPALSGGAYSRILVGDLQNDRFEDVIALGDKGSHLFKFETNGVVADVSAASRLATLSAVDGLLIDLDFTGKLDLIAVTGGTNTLRAYRQFGPLLFGEITATSGIPSSLHPAGLVMMEDWNRDGIMDLIVSRASEPPLLLEKQRGGPLVPREQTNWTAGAIFCAGDFDNDLRPDLAIVGKTNITICLNAGGRKTIGLPANLGIRQIVAVDHDNDGWLDLWAAGRTLRAWRNLGLSGFEDQTARLGLEQIPAGAITEVHFADFDKDCDPDAVLAMEGGGLRYLRNEGGNANSQVKVQLFGNRSNASGLGCKVEIQTGELRLIRTVQRLPVEIGVGKYQTLDSFVVHWFNWPQGMAEVPVNCQEPLLALELTIQEGSCPYLYAWDGRRFRFVTDILGAAPLGLPAAQGRYIEADPEEFVWIGSERDFPPKEGSYQVQITEELREVLYLDEAKLVVVDHELGTEVHPTGKLLPGKPFPRGTLLTLHNEQPLREARTLEGLEVTSALEKIDGRRVSPPKLRIPQLRGLAEPHGLVLDFGPLDAAKPLVLVMNGWLRFGGGMANVAASHDPSLPFPFPTLEVETENGVWKKLDVTVGAPAGKTKTILTDLEGKLEPGMRRLRLTQAFEIHWDRIALLEKAPRARTATAWVQPAEADLHFRGFSALRELPPDWPLTPDYESVSPNPPWTILPGGWCTRYGDVAELIATRDEALAVIHSGDELTLRFPVGSLPPKPTGAIRQFFLYVDGWDKDSDFHVAAGTQVEPLPYHGMNDQAYGRENRPRFPSDALHKQYNTRWVDGRALKQSAKR